jgi:hypothetical protein
MVEYLILNEDSCDMPKFWNGFIKDNSGGIAGIDLNNFTGIDDYIQKAYNQTARNLYRRALRAGVCAREITMDERNQRLDELHAINISAPMRQGKPMSEGYLQYPRPYGELNPERCPHHFAKWIGVFDGNGKWVGYHVGNYCGNFAATSTILGHAEHLKDNIMLVLWAEFVRQCMDHGIRYATYYLMNSGTQGLQHWKRSVGLVVI